MAGSSNDIDRGGGRPGGLLGSPRLPLRPAHQLAVGRRRRHVREKDGTDVPGRPLHLAQRQRGSRRPFAYANSTETYVFLVQNLDHISLEAGTHVPS